MIRSIELAGAGSGKVVAFHSSAERALGKARFFSVIFSVPSETTREEN